MMRECTNHPHTMMDTARPKSPLKHGADEGCDDEGDDDEGGADEGGDDEGGDD